MEHQRGPEHPLGQRHPGAGLIVDSAPDGERLQSGIGKLRSNDRLTGLQSDPRLEKTGEILDLGGARSLPATSSAGPAARLDSKRAHA